MTFYLIANQTSQYNVGDSGSTYLLREGNYIGSNLYGIRAATADTDNTYNIDGYVVAGQTYQGIKLEGKDGSALNTNNIQVGASGVISGGYGIWVSQDLLYLTNNGAIYGEAGDGVLLSNAADSGHWIANLGLISGTLDGLDLRSSGNVVDNFGIITGLGDGIDFTAGGQEVENSGQISGGSGSGIRTTDADNIFQNTSTGTITGGYGIRALDSANTSILNEGSIYGDLYAIHLSAALFGGSGSNHITNSGTIHSHQLDAIYVSGGSSVITNSGLLRSDEGNAVEVFDGTNTIINSGEIIGASRGIQLSGASDAGDRVENSGLISATGSYAIFSQSNDTSIINFDTGTISSRAASTNEAAIHLDGDDARVTNEGSVTASNTKGIRILGDVARIENSGNISARTRAIDIEGEDAYILNSGEISSFTEEAVYVSAFSSSFRLINTGSITSTAFADNAIQLIGTSSIFNVVNYAQISSVTNDAIMMSGTGNDLSLRNFGTINGDIILQDGDNTIRSQTGTIDGIIDLQGDGLNRIFLGDEDNIVYDRGSSADRFDLGGGMDLVLYAFSSTGVHVDLAVGVGYSGDARGDRLIDVEHLIGSAHDDYLLGNHEHNELNGGNGDDELIGRGGNDILLGFNGHDDLDGGSGDDLLRGGEGGDDLIGGTGADVFIYLSALDSAVTGIGRDRILDFEQGVDLIDLSDMGIEAFINQAAFTGTGTSEVRYQNVGGGTKTLVQIDTDGNGTADSAIIINNAFFNLTPDDFAL